MDNQVTITNKESYLATDGKVVEIFFKINNNDGSINMFVINRENVNGIQHFSIEEIDIKDRQ